MLLLLGCKRDDVIKKSRIDTRTPALTKIDRWIRTQLTEPYNVRAIYRFDNNELESKKYLTPPKPEVVVPYLKSLLKLWIQPYEQYGGKAFVKIYMPKLFVLVGDHNVNPDGTITQGLTEGGKKVTIYELDAFLDRAKHPDQPELKRYYHVIHHEFGHVLTQNKAFDREAFLEITPGDYDSGWFNRNKQQALDLGFISPYAADNVDEDFVELVATILTNTPEEVDAIISQASPSGAEKIKKKIKLVKGYFKSAWGIDMDVLQKTIHKNLQAYLANLKSSNP